jgi:hypothetical protein
VRARILTALIGTLGLAAGVARADNLHLYSYDPADAATVRAAGPLTFTFKKGLLHNTVLNLRSTISPATAYLSPADERALGRAGLSGAVGHRSSDRDLYEVKPEEQGAALISAFCPGSKRAWMAFGPVRFNRGLEVLVLGAPATGGEPKLCRTLEFNFHGEWLLPAGRSINPRELQHKGPGNPTPGT